MVLLWAPRPLATGSSASNISVVDNICRTYTVITDPAHLAEHLRRTCESEQKKTNISVVVQWCTMTVRRWPT